MAKAADEPITAIFRDWAARLKQLGITEIKGDLLFDDTIFELEHVHPSWQGRFNLQQWYTAPVGGLNFNDNCLDVLIKPAKTVGRQAAVTLIPNTPWTILVNKTKTAKKGEPLISRSGDGPITVTVSGKVSRPNSEEDPFSLTIDDPGQFFAATCRTVLAARGVKIRGETKRRRVRLADGSLPKDLKVVAVYERKLKDMLWRCNKSSQNMFAEALFKTIGYHKSNPAARVGSNKTANAAVLAFLDELGLDTEGMVIDDGSGLSHENRCTPDAIARVLMLMHYTSMAEVYRSSMATPGEPVGTLRKRLKDLAGKVFAKTGTISGVSALSGYVDGPDDRQYAFCVLCNDTHRAKGGTSAARQVQDAVCRKLATWKPAEK
jgi:D-alanyl-D-alanine carboxypeptidase/D-alanyl-D-alanine-endopeptidase (penicillin-binding protein 4)